MREIFAEFGALGTPDPTHWERYDVYIDRSGRVDGTITTKDGEEYALTDRNVDFDESDWEWVWDIWDWLETEYGDDFDKDTVYAE
jgi:hypothetical protein